MKTLVLNAGSSSLKFDLFDEENHSIVSHLYENIGEEATHYPTHKEAIDALYEEVKEYSDSIGFVGHRVVHGGPFFKDPVHIDENTLQALRDTIPLAPLHNPANILGIECAQVAFPQAKHFAVFDTGFHQTLPEYAANYAINPVLAKELHIRHYGFHGISHEYVSQVAANYLGKALSDTQFISLHLGNGASACAIKGGKSIDTTMGMTPLAGLVMGTRSGDIDAGVLLTLMREKGYDEKALNTLLNKKSGLLGMTGSNDMRDIETMVGKKDPEATLAVELFVYRIQKYIGAYYTQLPSLDSLIFTAGIGENASFVRERVCEGLSHLGIELDKGDNASPNRPCDAIDAEGSRVKILVIQTNEALQIAKLIRAKV